MRAERLLDNVTAGVERIAPYQPGKSAAQVAGGRDPSGFVKLASNENPLGCGPRALEAVRAFGADDVGRYPDADGSALKEAVAARLGVGTANVILGNGSNDVLELCAQLFLRPGTGCVFARHAFLVYELATLARGAVPVVVPDRDFNHDLEAMAEACRRPEARLVFVANPNNPTGGHHPPERILGFVRSVPESVLVVLDEAYHEYMDDGIGESIAWTKEFPNLVVTRSFSKIHGLAGLRIGYGIGPPEVVGMMNRVRQPFNTSAVAQAAALAALGDDGFIARSREMNAQGIGFLREEFARLGISHPPITANFVMARFDDAAAIHRGLLEDGLIVRPLGNYGLKDHLRITVGTPDENARLVASLGRLLR